MRVVLNHDALAALAATSGLIAQDEVEVDEAAHDLLVTHRMLNLGVLGWTAAMAVYRASRERVGSGYLAAVVALCVTLFEHSNTPAPVPSKATAS